VITPAALLGLGESRLEDAECLAAAGRCAGAVYLCGYAVELFLKRRICLTLGWAGWPDSGEFTKIGSLKTHDLEILLKFSGLEAELRRDPGVFLAWQLVSVWDPETRYKTLDDEVTLQDARAILDSTRVVLGFLR
jgi:hypothetical protein